MNTLLLLLAGLMADAPNVSPSDAAAAQSSDVPKSELSPQVTILSIAENSPPGTVVGSVTAAADPSSNRPTYEIVGGNDSDIYAIDSASGKVFLRDGFSLDYETRSSYELTIEVTTTANPNDENQKRFIEQLRKTGADEDTISQSLRRTTERVVRLEVTDVNETPLFEEHSFRLDGKSPAGSIVGTLTAADPDQGDHLQYTVGDEATDQIFAINPTTGEITVRDPEAIRSHFSNGGAVDYQATFQVADAAGLVDITSVTIAISPPPPPPVVAEIPHVEPTAEPANPTEETSQHTSEPLEASSKASEPIAVPIAETESETEQSDVIPPKVEQPEIEHHVQPTDVVPAAQEVTAEISTTEPKIEAPSESSGSGSFSRFMNFVFLAILVGGGLRVYKLSKSQKEAVGRQAEDEARFAAFAAMLETQKTGLEQLQSQLEQENARLEQEANSLSARQQQLEALEKELEAQRAELAAAAERFQEEHANIEAERQRLAEAFQEIERHEQELAERKAAFNDAMTTGDRTETESIDAAEQLLNMAVDNDLKTPEVESAEVLELRNRLADMFGVAESEFSRPRSVRQETEYDGIVKADDRELTRPNSRPEPSPTYTAASAESSSAVQTQEEEAEAPDSVAAYMRELLERQRVQQLYGSSPLQTPAPIQRPAVPPTVAPMQVLSSTPVPAVVEELKPISETPVHPQDKDAVRSGLSSLREVANQAARSAVLKHTKKKLRKHSLIKIGSAIVAFLTAGIVFSGSVPVTSMLGWAAFGIGGIMLVDLGHWAYLTRKKAAHAKLPRD